MKWKIWPWSRIAEAEARVAALQKCVEALADQENMLVVGADYTSIEDAVVHTRVFISPLAKNVRLSGCTFIGEDKA